MHVKLLNNEEINYVQSRRIHKVFNDVANLLSGEILFTQISYLFIRKSSGCFRYQTHFNAATTKFSERFLFTYFNE